MQQEINSDIDPLQLADHVLRCMQAEDRLGALSIDTSSATSLSIKQAYRSLSKILHPDKTKGDKKCAEAFIALKKCKDELSAEGALEKEIATRCGNGVMGSTSKTRDILLSGGFHRTLGKEFSMMFSTMQRDPTTPSYMSSGSVAYASSYAPKPKMMGEHTPADIFGGGGGGGSNIKQPGGFYSTSSTTTIPQQMARRFSPGINRRGMERKKGVPMRPTTAKPQTRKQPQHACTGPVKRRIVSTATKTNGKLHTSSNVATRRRNSTSTVQQQQQQYQYQYQVNGPSMHTVGVSIKNPMNMAWNSIGTPPASSTLHQPSLNRYFMSSNNNNNNNNTTTGISADSFSSGNTTTNC